MGTLASELQLKVRVNTFPPLLIRMNAGKTSRCGGVASAFSITYNTYICKRDTFYLIHAHSPRTTCTPTAEASEATEASEAIASRPFSTAKHVVEQAVQHCKALCSRLCSTACLVMFGRPCSTVMIAGRCIVAGSAPTKAPRRFSGDVLGIEVVTIAAIRAHRCSGVREWLLYRKRMWCFTMPLRQ